MDRNLFKALCCRAAALLALLLSGAVVSCEKAPLRAPLANSLPPPEATGIEVTTLEVTPPPGTDGRGIFAGLKRDGRIVARGAGVMTATGTVEVVLRTMDRATSLSAGDYELWVTIDRVGMKSCYPAFGDLYFRDTWHWPKVGSAVALDDVRAWKDKVLSRDENLITVHYHRYDDDYDNVGIWTWDGNYKRTPEQNEIYEVGRDDYGLVYQIDRGEYGLKGDSDKIGMLPRLSASWDRKDGDDKYWHAAMGNEIYLIGTRNRVWSKLPDISPQVVAAYIDAPNRLAVEVSRLMDANDCVPEAFTVMDEQKSPVALAYATLVLPKGKEQSNIIELKTARPLDIGHHTYQVSVTNFAGSQATEPRGVLDDPALFCDTNAVLGATYAPAGTTFRVFAPTARAVQVVLYDAATGDQGRQTHELQEAAKGIWEGTVSGDLKGRFYMYSLDGNDLSPDREVLDIYSINTVNSSQRARITDLAETNPSGWDAAKAGPAVSSAADMIVYEVHVRDFSIAANSGMQHKGQYLAFTEPGTHLPDDAALKTGLDHLQELGITHVQLLPVQDFENDETGTNYNWGYVTTAYDSPEGWYATDINNDSRIRELKQLIQALHQRGIGVIMDVVYNHTAASAPFNFLVPKYYYRFMPDGANSNGSGCGNDFRSESPMGRKYIIDSLTYWAREYGIDGFRFDLMALIDIQTMKQAERELRKINPSIVLYGEPWGGGGPAAPVQATNKRAIRGTRIGAFNDTMRNELVGSPFEKAATGFVQDGSHAEQLRHGVAGSWQDWAPTPAQAINFISCHDNYTGYDKLKLSKPGATDEEINDMMKVGYLLLFTSQGVPFLQAGEEFARSKGGEGNSYNAPDSVNGIDWSLKKKNHDLFTYIRDVIAIRKAHPVFRLRAKEQIAAWLKFIDAGDPDVLMYTLDGSNVADETWKQVCVVVNAADDASSAVMLPAGTWHVACDHNGAADNRTVEGSVRVRYKSGMILYQP